MTMPPEPLARARVPAAQMPEDYFALQLTFASHCAAVAKVPFDVAVARCTNLRRRLNLGGPGGADRWEILLARMRASAHDPAALIAMCREFHDTRPDAVAARAFGCFSYEPADAAGVVRMHFMPPADIASSPLAAANAPHRRQELREMFLHIRRTEPSARSVLGISWLYNLDAYRRLFPADYVTSIRRPWFPLHLNGSSTWGQVLDWRQDVKPAMRRALLDRLGELNAAAPWEIFPLQAQVASCALDAFDERWGEDPAAVCGDGPAHRATQVGPA